MNTTVMYGADWCPDCRRAKAFLAEHEIEYDYHDTELDETAVEVVERLNNGKRVIPTFEILGKAYSNPDNTTLARLLGVNPVGRVIMYGADWCPDCRRAKSFLRDNHVNFQFIDVEEFEWAAEIVEGINAGRRVIPTLVINGEGYSNPDNPTLRSLLQLDRETDTHTYDSVIIGAGATGLTAAIYLERARHDTVLLEKSNVGGNAFLTSAIENYPGFTNISGPELMDRMAEQATGYGSHLKQGVEVQSIKEEDGFFSVQTNDGVFQGETVVVASGSQYRRLEVPGEEELVGIGVHFCATCDAPFYKNKNVLVIGGGNTAVEEGIYLSTFAEHVTFVTRGPEFTADPIYTEKFRTLQNATTLRDKTPQRFLQNDDGSFQGLEIRDNVTGDVQLVEADGAFVFVGLEPNTQFLDGVVELTREGFVKTGAGSATTNVPGIFAAGDCRQGAIAQVAAATGEGVLASYAVHDYLKDAP